MAPRTAPDLPTGCEPGLHDGGDGTCLDEGTCVDGYAIVSNGSCGEILLEDDFEDGVIADDWLTWHLLFEEADGQIAALSAPDPDFLYGHNGNGRSGTLVTNIGDETWTDYRLELDLESLAVGGVQPATPSRRVIAR